MTFKNLTSHPVVICLLSLLLHSTLHAEDKGLASLFQEHNVTGTIILSSLEGQQEYIYNAPRAKKRFLPASTFKIPHTLIALDEKAIADDKEVLLWDGKDKGWSPWNQNHTLATAFPVSCVWCYQRLAARVGPKAYLSHLKALGYGNQQTGPDVTRFWLDGDLKISAQEQIHFLKKLYRHQLPYQAQHIDLLKAIMVEEKTATYTLRAKTGWATKNSPAIGWYVGYVETPNGVWFFATNINMHQRSEAPLRKKITQKALQLKGILK